MEKLLNYMLYTHDVHVIWVDETTGIMIPIEKINKNVSILKKKSFFKGILHNFSFLLLCAFISIQNIGRSIPFRQRFTTEKYLRPSQISMMKLFCQK